MGTVTEKGNHAIRQDVARSRTFSDTILPILGEDPNFKRGDVFRMMIEKLGLDGDNLPPNIPSDQKVRNKVRNFRRFSSDKDSAPTRK